MRGTRFGIAVPYPQHPNKHRQRPLFTAAEFHRYEARRTGIPPAKAPRSIVLWFGRRWKRYLGRRFPGALDPRTRVYRASASVGVVLVSGPGAPQTAIVMEELAAIGARRFVLVGLAGSLQPNLRAGELVLCSRALRDEGTSHHYAKPGAFARPSPRLTARLRGSLEQAGARFREGPSWTIDAPYRETVAEVRRYRRQRILTVEMEASAAFAVANSLGGEAAALFVVSDHLDEGGWEPRFQDSRVGMRNALHLAIAALSA